MKDIDKDTRKIFHDIHIAQTEITSINKRLKSLISTSELKINKDYFLNKICVDLGCGSGGFATQNLLNLGASFVHAIKRRFRN